MSNVYMLTTGAATATHGRFGRPAAAPAVRPLPEPRALVALPAGASGARARTYAADFCGLLGLKAHNFETPTCAADWLDSLVRASIGCDLVALDRPDPPRVHRLLRGSPNCRAAARVAASVLVARGPRWPINRVLLVTRGGPQHEHVVRWVDRLADRSSFALVTLLVVPEMAPATHRALELACASVGWPHGAMLSCGAIVGSCGPPARRNTRTSTRCRPGSPEAQVRREVQESDPDFIVVGAGFGGWGSRRLLGGLCGALLGWADRPVLVAKP